MLPFIIDLEYYRKSDSYIYSTCEGFTYYAILYNVILYIFVVICNNICHMYIIKIRFL